MVGDAPAVEFNMKFFDEKFQTIEQRLKILEMFPPEFAKGYVMYKKSRLKDEAGNTTGWYLLDPDKTVKFSLGNGRLESPFFITVIPSIIDLENAQELDRKK